VGTVREISVRPLDIGLRSLGCAFALSDIELQNPSSQNLRRRIYETDARRVVGSGPGLRAVYRARSSGIPPTTRRGCDAFSLYSLRPVCLAFGEAGERFTRGCYGVLKTNSSQGLENCRGALKSSQSLETRHWVLRSWIRVSKAENSFSEAGDQETR
jgi:hypothetical protein